MLRHIVGVVCVGLVVLAPGCVRGHGGPLNARLSPFVQRPKTGVVVFLCDGLAPRFVQQGCREGWLPNINRRFLTAGAEVEYATTCVPPITYAAIATLLTGYGPERHNIVGNRWFDPRQCLFRDYVTMAHYRDIDGDATAPTLYEHLRPHVSANIQTAQMRGVTRNFANWAASGVMWQFGDYTAVDKLTATTVEEVADWANAVRRWPAVLTCYFPGGDSVGHDFGAGSVEYRRSAEHIDYQVGRICDWLEKEGLLETTYLFLVSDHGMVDVKVGPTVDLLALVRDGWGRAATSRTLQDGSEESRPAFFEQFDTVVAHQNGRAAFLYFRGPEGWGVPPTPEVVENILHAAPEDQQPWNLPGVELVTYLAGPDEAVLRSARGTARVRREHADGEARYMYEPAPDDVLGYLEDPALAAFVKAGFHTSRAWLEASARERLPDVVPHLIPLLHGPRAGQVVIFTQPGYSFVPERGGHGGLDRDERLMTFLAAGPGIPPGRKIACARATDLVPTILDLLGVPYANNQWPESKSLIHDGLMAPAEAAR